VTPLVKGEYIIPRSIAEFIGDPPYPFGQIRSIELLEPETLVVQHELFTAAAKFAIAEIALNWIKLTNQPLYIHSAACNW